MAVVCFLISAVVFLNRSAVEANANIRNGTHTMLGSPNTKYDLVLVTAVFYAVPGVILLLMALRKPTIGKSIATLIGSFMFSIVVISVLFGRTDTGLLMPLGLGCALLYFGYERRAPKEVTAPQQAE
jgi:4-amino-4-deoxy-L-arabinose transferase-like glycosyltransferase